MTSMAQFILETVGQESDQDGNLVTVRGTGFGGRHGPLLARAKAKAITVTRFGSRTATENKVTDTGSGIEEETVFADKSDDLFKGPLSGVQDRIQAFRKDGLLVEVQDIKELKTDRVIDSETLDEAFGPTASAAKTYEYKVLVSTSFALS